MNRLSLLATTLLITLVCSAPALAAKSSQLNLDDDNIALHGYDPVSYHRDGPVPGRDDITQDRGGVTYRFASRENMQAFAADPETYLPAFGGWCAWAMLEGEKVDVDPETYKIVNGKTYLFYNAFFTNTLTKWNELAEKEGESSLIQQADSRWSDLVGMDGSGG